MRTVSDHDFQVRFKELEDKIKVSLSSEDVKQL